MIHALFIAIMTVKAPSVPVSTAKPSADPSAPPHPGYPTKRVFL